MGKWLNKFINGDPKKKDFTKEDLPDNRFDQYFDIIKIRFTGLLTVNLLYVMFLVPLLLFALWIFVFGLPQLQVINPDASDAELFEQLIEWVNSFLLLAIPLYTISGPAKAGMYYVLRNWSWGEHAQAGKDFWMEFKRSWKYGLLYNFITGVVVYAAFFWLLNGLYAENTMTDVVKFILVGVVSLLVFLFLLMDTFVYPLMVTYKLNFRQLIKNAFLLGVSQLPKAFCCILATAACLFIIALLPEITVVVALVIGVALLELGKMLVANSVFDKYNKYLTDDKAPTRRGLSPKKDKLGRVIKD